MKRRRRLGSSLYHLLQLHPTSHLSSPSHKYMEGLSKRFHHIMTLITLMLAPQVGPQDTYQANPPTHMFVKSHSMAIEKTFIQALNACSGLRRFLQFQLLA